MGLTPIAARGSLSAGGSITMRDTAVYSLVSARLTPRTSITDTAQAATIIGQRTRSRSRAGSKAVSTSSIYSFRTPLAEAAVIAWRL